MLEGAASTSIKDRTGRSPAVWRRLQKLFHPPLGPSLLFPRQGDPNPILRRRTGHEDNPSIRKASHTNTPGADAPDFHFEPAGVPLAAHPPIPFP